MFCVAAAQSAMEEKKTVQVWVTSSSRKFIGVLSEVLRLKHGAKSDMIYHDFSFAYHAKDTMTKAR